MEQLSINLLNNENIKLIPVQDPVSIMQKTSWNINSSFLVLSVLEKGFSLDLITKAQSTTIFVCIGPFLV